MAENIKVRVVIEEVVVDFEGQVHSVYPMKDIENIIKKAVDAALELHAKRKEKHQ